MTRAKPEHVNKLTQKETWKLLNLVKERYTASGQNNSTFAAMATEELGFPCTTHNVEGACKTLDIPNNFSTKNRPESGSLEALARRVKALEDRVEVYLTGCRKGTGG